MFMLSNSLGMGTPIGRCVKPSTSFVMETFGNQVDPLIKLLLEEKPREKSDS